MILILFLSMTTSIFSNKNEIRKIYPEIWEKLQGMRYEYNELSFLLEDNREIVYCEAAKKDQLVCLNQNCNQRVSSIYSRPICGLHSELF